MSTAVLASPKAKKPIPVNTASRKASRNKSTEDLDARRRLEEKLEDRRLTRELKEFEFDF
jgi:hypothetical protein